MAQPRQKRQSFIGASMPNKPTQPWHIVREVLLRARVRHQGHSLWCHLLDVPKAHADVKPVELGGWCPLSPVPDNAG